MLDQSCLKTEVFFWFAENKQYKKIFQNSHGLPYQTQTQNATVIQSIQHSVKNYLSFANFGHFEDTKLWYL